MQKKLTAVVKYTVFVALMLSAVTGCTYLKFPGVYRIAVLQGNIIDPKKVDQLEVGMTKRQVQYVMGSALVQDLFEQDRWDYVYMLRRGEDTLRKRRFSVYFEGDKLVRFEGDFVKKEQQPTTEDYIEDAQKTEG